MSAETSSQPLTAAAALERRYRRALRWFPKHWRDRHEEVVLSTLLDGADAEGRTRPARGEVGNLVVTGLATRASAILPTELRDMIATASLATGTALALVFTVVFSWSPWAAPDEFWAERFAGFGPFADPGPVLYLLWPAAFVLYLLKRTTAMRWVLAAAVVVPPLLRLANLVQGDIWPGPSMTSLGLFALLAGCALLGTPRRGMRMAAAVFVAAAMASVVLVVTNSLSMDYVSGRSFGQTHGTAVPLVVAGMLAVALFLGTARQGALASFIAVLAGPWAVLCLMGELRSRGGGDGLLVVAVIGIAVLAHIAIRRGSERPLQAAVASGALRQAQ